MNPDIQSFWVRQCLPDHSTLHCVWVCMSACVCVCMLSHSVKSYPTLCNPMDCSPPGSSVHGISQARILVWVAMISSRGSSWPWDWTHVSCVPCIDRQILYHFATWEAPTHLSFEVSSWEKGDTIEMERVGIFSWGIETLRLLWALRWRCWVSN